MRHQVNLESGNKQIEIKVRRKHRDEYFAKAKEAMDLMKKQGQDPNEFDFDPNFVNFEEKITKDCITGLTEVELEELYDDLEQFNEVVYIVRNIITKVQKKT